MERQETSLERQVVEAAMTTTRDRARAAVLGGVGSIPFFGGVMENLIEETIPSMRAKRVEQLWLDIAATIEQHETDIESLVKAPPPDYPAIVEMVLVEIQRTASEVKRKAYAAIIINALSSGDSDAEEREYFLEAMTRLRTIHISILGAMTAHQDGQAGGRDLMETLRLRVRSYSEDQLRLAWGELHDMSLINTPASSLTAMSTAQGAAVLNARLTDLGRRLVAFITTA